MAPSSSQKAAQPSSVDAGDTPVHQVADRAVPMVARTVRSGLEQVRGAVSEQAILGALLDGGRVDRLIPWDQVFTFPDLGRVRVAKVSGDQAARDFLRIMVRASNGAGLPEGRFDLTNWRAVQTAYQQAATLVVGIQAQTRQAIARIIGMSVAGRYTPVTSARLIRQIVGLTPRQAVAVANYRAGLEAVAAGGAPSQVAGYSLADSRFTPRAGMRPDQVDRMVSRYASRQHRWRSMNIARTETMRAANRGVRLNTLTMRDQGLIGHGTRFIWHTTPDERLCDTCAPMNGMTVGLEEQFHGTVGVQDLTTFEPPIHPMCRCTITVDAVPAPGFSLG